MCINCKLLLQNEVGAYITSDAIVSVAIIMDAGVSGLLYGVFYY